MKYMQWNAKRQNAAENIRKQKDSEREVGEYIHQAAKRMIRGRERWHKHGQENFERI